MSDFMEFDTLEYHFTDEDTVPQNNRQIPERTLWCAVINLAFEDARSGSFSAREWLLHERGDFLNVCALAGISPFCVRVAARRMSRNAWL